MRRQLVAILSGLSLMSLCACSHTYIPGPGKVAAEYPADAARCHLYAESTRPGMAFQATGSPRTVAAETGAALFVGGVATLAHDSEVYNDCMQANGWLLADSTGRPLPVAGLASPAAAPPAATGAVPLPVAQEPLPVPVVAPPPVPVPVIYAPRRAAVARAQRAAEAWLIAQRILNGPATPEQRSLYRSLCRAGDRTACFMAGMP